MSNVVEYTIRAIDDFSKTMSSMELSVSKAEEGMVKLGIAAAVAGAAYMIKEALANADAMGVMAVKANMATDEFSALAWAVKMSDGEVGDLATGLKKLQMAMAEGDLSPAGKQLSQLGVAAKDANGNMRPTIDVLLDLSDAFQNGAADANKTKIAIDLFGRGGASLVPLLNQGSEAIKGMMEDAKKLGVVISDDFAASANQVNDNLATLAQVMKGRVSVAMAEMSPVIEQLTGQLIDMSTQGDSVAKMGHIMAAALRVLVSSVLVVIGVFKTLGDIIGGLAAALVSLAQGEFKQAYQALHDTAQDMGTNIAATVVEVGKVWDDAAQSAAAASAKQARAAMAMKESMDALSKASEDARKEHEKLLKAIADTDQKMYASILTTGMSSESTKLYELRQKGATEAELGRLPALAELTDLMKKHNEQFAAATSIISGQQTALEKHEDTIDAINTLYRDGEMTVDQHTQALERETLAWNVAKQSTDEYKWGVTSAMDVAGTQITAHLRTLGNTAFQIGSMVANVFDTVVKGLGDAVADAVLDGKSLSDSLSSLAKVVEKQVISTLVQIGIQRAILSTGIVTAYATEAGASTATSATMVAGGTAVSVAWGPFIVLVVGVVAAIYILNEAVKQFGPVAVAVGIAVGAAWLPIATIAAAVLAAIYLINEAIKIMRKAFEGDVPPMLAVLAPLLLFFKTLKDAVEAVLHAVNAVKDGISSIPGANIARGVGDAVSNTVGSIGSALGFDGGGYTGDGARSGGLDGKGGFWAVMHPQETVIDHTQGQGVGGGVTSVTIQNLTVHVMENATNADVFKSMDRIQLRNAIGQPVVDALNEMFSIGVRPNFATTKG